MYILLYLPSENTRSLNTDCVSVLNHLTLLGVWCHLKYTLGPEEALRTVDDHKGQRAARWSRGPQRGSQSPGLLPNTVTSQPWSRPDVQEVELGVQGQGTHLPCPPKGPSGGSAPCSLPRPCGHSPLNMMASPWPSFCFSRKSL